MNFRISLSVSADPKFQMETKGTQNSPGDNGKRTKLVDSHCLVSKLPEKLQSSRQGGTGIRIGIQTDGTKLKIHK